MSNVETCPLYYLFFLLLSIPLYLYRIPKEEIMMLKQFGEEYKEYMKKTGRIFPKFR